MHLQDKIGDKELKTIHEKLSDEQKFSRVFSLFLLSHPFSPLMKEGSWTNLSINRKTK